MGEDLKFIDFHQLQIENKKHVQRAPLTTQSTRHHLQNDGEGRATQLVRFVLSSVETRICHEMERNESQ